MNILFVLYGTFDTNSSIPLALYARELSKAGHDCTVAVPRDVEAVNRHGDISFRPALYDEVLANPAGVFADSRPADVIHACTPRELVRKFVVSYQSKIPTPLVIYLEDNEAWITQHALGLDEREIASLSAQEIEKRLPESLSHPFYLNCFIGLADAVAVIQEKLRAMVPNWVHCEIVMIGIDIDFFSPRLPDVTLRERYGISEHEKILVYHGGMNQFTRPAIKTLCQAVGLINKHGTPCRLLRTGPYKLDFFDELAPESLTSISDIGVLPMNELPGLLALADVFVQPGSIEEFEDLRLPGKVPEFLAMGRPVIMPDINIASLFDDGINVVLLRTGSAEEIADKCMELFGDPARMTEIGMAGRALAEKYFDVKNQSMALARLYESACKRFDAKVAGQVWVNNKENAPFTLRIVQKLRLMVGNEDFNAELDPASLLEDYAKYLEFSERHISGLERRLHGENNMALVHNRDDAQQQLDSILSSSSWRLTAPLRVVGNFIKRLSGTRA